MIRRASSSSRPSSAARIARRDLGRRGQEDGEVVLWDAFWRDFSDLKARVCGFVHGNLTAQLVPLDTPTFLPRHAAFFGDRCALVSSSRLSELTATGEHRPQLSLNQAIPAEHPHDLLALTDVRC
jgi:hypothetical protein